MITFHAQTLADEGEPVSLDCPACNAQNVESRVFERVDYVKLLYLIPLVKLRSTTIQCGQCDAGITCMVPLDRISGMSSDELKSHIRYHADGKAKLSAVIGFLTCWIPFIGLLIGSVACFLGRGMTGWVSGLNVLSMIVAITSSIIYGLVVFMPAP